ncbi:tetratricopeptide (TPR) repeat protein [Rhodopirellula rubra]|uniref:Tetratricopeptide (TPR) repeat protein n=1 Tax=Aporhodopirellula rubra TaxID=980271 RepID=A0A7W5H5J2_9BACT|nr:tetratricopeptide repeat protein [Aporhodopirellula rubra]MBB3206303.1 tetratricopeptide (TPR) repeat protein [Aporhodopirellula rubra]
MTGYFLLTTAFASSTQLSTKYVQAGRAASRGNDWSSATLYLERAIELGVRDRDAMFELAIASDRSNDLGRRDAILQKLGPLDKPVHAPAHLWNASRLLSLHPIPKEKLESAEKQLRNTLAVDPSNVNAHGILGDLYFQRGYLEGATFHLGRASQTLPHYQILYAKACILTGRTAEAEASAERALRLTTQRLGANPKDQASRIERGEALFILERFDQAAKNLREGLRQSGDVAPLHKALARTYLGWADKLLTQEGATRHSRPQAFQLIAAAMSQNPDDADVFNRMLQLVSIDDSATKKARDFLFDNIATGKAVGLSHLLLGTSFQEAGVSERANFHLEQAFKLLPEAPIVANNLAWHLIKRTPPQIDRAMKLISTVLDRHPNTPAFIDTRANIYLEQQKWQLALDDFQVSLTEFPEVESVHRGMARAYHNLNMLELEERHRLIADHLQLTGRFNDGEATFRLPK